MSAEFSFPDWWANAPEPPPPAPPPVDADRIEGLANRFITASHGVLHTAPDAFYGKAAADAVEGAPAVAAQLSALRDATLELAGDEHERRALADRLEPYHRLALDDVDRHVAEQRQVLARQIIADRQALIRQAAGLKHNEDALGGLAEANASAARSLARLDGVPEEPAMQAARSALWRSAIDQRLADGEGARALGLFEQAKGELVPADQRALEVPIQAARTDAVADAWIVRETAKEGEPLAVRVQADATLSPAEKATTLAKVEARDSAQESARVATVQGLDDKLEATADALATKPGNYKPGALAALANAYEDAGESAKAGTIRRLAQREGFLQSFARSSAAAQQRLIDGLPDGDDRAAAEAIQDRQAEAFAKDPYGAGTALYPDVGPPKSIDDIAGRIAQARTIAAYRGVSVLPFTAGELATMRLQYAQGTPQEREAALAVVNSLPEDMKPAFDGPSPGGPGTFRIDAQASMEALHELPDDGADQNAATTTTGSRAAVQAPEPAPDSEEYRTADAQARGLAAQEKIATDRMINQWVSQAHSGDEVPPELAERLGTDQKHAIEALVSKVDDVKTDPTVFREILAGLKSRNPEEARRWAQAPLYQDRVHLSAKDYAKVVELQQDLDPEGGYSRSELAAIRTQLKAADTSDLAPLYKALEANPNAQYGTHLPFAKDANGVRPAMPERARTFLKGVLDLLTGTKNGELTPDAAAAFTTVTGGAGRVFGPRGGAETMAAGGKRPTNPRRLTHAERAAENFAKGRAWEVKRAAYYRAKGYEVAEQIMVLLPSGQRMRLDLVFRHPNTKEIVIIELKASENPRIRKLQRLNYEELEKFGGKIVGVGKGEFTGGSR